MEKRSSKRKSINLKANIIIDGNTYNGFIKNVSESGIGYLITSSIHISKDFTPVKKIKLNFQIPANEDMTLLCEVIWFLRTSSDAEILTLGMKIIDPPQQYAEWIKNLISGNVLKKQG
jgi:hypothetical protein